MVSKNVTITQCEPYFQKRLNETAIFFPFLFFPISCKYYLYIRYVQTCFRAIPFLLIRLLQVGSNAEVFFLEDHFLWKLTAAIHLGVCIVGVTYSLSVLLLSETGSKNLLKSEEGR